MNDDLNVHVRVVHSFCCRDLIHQNHPSIHVEGCETCNLCNISHLKYLSRRKCNRSATPLQKAHQKSHLKMFVYFKKIKVNYKSITFVYDLTLSTKINSDVHIVSCMIKNEVAWFFFSSLGTIPHKAGTECVLATQTKAQPTQKVGYWLSKQHRHRTQQMTNVSGGGSPKRTPVAVHRNLQTLTQLLHAH